MYWSMNDKSFSIHKIVSCLQCDIVNYSFTDKTEAVFRCDGTYPCQWVSDSFRDRYRIFGLVSLFLPYASSLCAPGTENEGRN